MAIQFVETFFNIYLFMIFIKILASWIPELSQTRFMGFVSFFVDPYLNLFRQIIPPFGAIDISPIVAIFALQFLENGVKYIIHHFL